MGENHGVLLAIGPVREAVELRLLSLREYRREMPAVHGDGRPSENVNEPRVATSSDRNPDEIAAQAPFERARDEGICRIDDVACRTARIAAESGGFPS